MWWELSLREFPLPKVTQNVLEAGFRSKQFTPSPVVFTKHLKTRSTGDRPGPWFISLCLNSVFKMKTSPSKSGFLVSEKLESHATVSWAWVAAAPSVKARAHWSPPPHTDYTHLLHTLTSPARLLQASVTRTPYLPRVSYVIPGFYLTILLMGTSRPSMHWLLWEISSTMDTEASNNTRHLISCNNYCHFFINKSMKTK